MKSKEYLKNIRKKDIKILYKDLHEKYNNLYDLRFSAKFRNLKDVKKIKKNKHEIAQIYTIIVEKLKNG